MSTEPKRMRQLRVESVDLVDLGEASNARITVAKRREDVAKNHSPSPEQAPAADPVAKEGPPMNLDQLLAELGPEKAKIVMDALAAAKAPMPAEKAACPDPKADVMKDLPADVQKRLADLEAIEKRANEDRLAKEKADREAVEKRNKDLAEQVEKLRDAEATREYVAKARKLEHVPQLSTDELAQVMKRLDRGEAIPADLAAKLSASFTATHELVAKQAREAFQERGSSGGGPKTGSAIAEIEAVAKRMRDADPKLSKADSIVRAARENQDLYKRYSAELAGKRD